MLLRRRGGHHVEERALRVLYLDTYTVSDPKVGIPSSDAIGYGLTASGAIQRGLADLGFEVVRPQPEGASRRGSPRYARLQWIIDGYRSILDALRASPPDLIFSFHIFSAFPVELRRILLDLGLSIPLVGYTHGSHWDETDAFRFEAYPGLELLDLANLDVLDRVLLVSEYMRSTLRRSIGAFHAGVAEQIDAKACVVGLPIDIATIDRYSTTESFERLTVVFNHAPVSSKNPALFVRVMSSVMARYPVNVLFTRRFDGASPAFEAVTRLAGRFEERVILGNDMRVADYYKALWMSHIQVSTATHESLGISTLEAMYTGNCCILPRLGSYPEICENHPEVLYDLGEAELEERLSYFIEQPERRRAVAAELSGTALRYRPAEVVGRIAGVITQLCAASRS
jgi:glycosyltransferase involved in cell wall biosynthesis